MTERDTAPKTEKDERTGHIHRRTWKAGAEWVCQSSQRPFTALRDPCRMNRFQGQNLNSYPVISFTHGSLRFCILVLWGFFFFFLLIFNLLWMFTLSVYYTQLQSLLFLMLKLSQKWLVEIPSNQLLWSFDTSPLIFEHLLAFWHVMS